MYVKGSGLFNKLLNKLSVKLHLPGYQYCGPGTKLSKQLAHADLGINNLADETLAKKSSRKSLYIRK